MSVSMRTLSKYQTTISTQTPRFLYTRALIFWPFLGRLMHQTDGSVDHLDRQEDSVQHSIYRSSAVICVRSAMELATILCDSLMENSE